jgi:hypothetical protein
MTELTPGLADAFALCAAELGMFSATRLFARSLLEETDAQCVGEVLELLGSRYPVFDVVARRALTERTIRPIDAGGLSRAVANLSRLVVVGIEAECLDALLLLPQRPRLALVLDALEGADMERVAANYEGEVTLLDLGSFQRWAGRSSALMTTVYGSDGYQATVCQAWLRAHGPDVRTRFNTILGFNVLGARMDAYPRWLCDTDARDFAPLIGQGEGDA